MTLSSDPLPTAASTSGEYLLCWRSGSKCNGHIEGASTAYRNSCGELGGKRLIQHPQLLITQPLTALNTRRPLGS